MFPRQRLTLKLFLLHLTHKSFLSKAGIFLLWSPAVIVFQNQSHMVVKVTLPYSSMAEHKKTIPSSSPKTIPKDLPVNKLAISWGPICICLSVSGWQSSAWGAPLVHSWAQLSWGRVQGLAFTVGFHITPQSLIISPRTTLWAANIKNPLQHCLLCTGQATLQQSPRIASHPGPP